MNNHNTLTDTKAERPLILLVEDDRDTRELFKETLHLAGVECVTANSVVEAISVLQNKRITLIVLDWGLGDRSGAEVLRCAKEKDATMPVIVMSGLSCDVRTDALLEQADVFLAKPLSAAVLNVQVKQLLKRAGNKSWNFPLEREEDILPLEEMNALYIHQVVNRLGSDTKAAKALGVHRRTVANHRGRAAATPAACRRHM